MCVKNGVCSLIFSLFYVCCCNKPCWHAFLTNYGSRSRIQIWMINYLEFKIWRMSVPYVLSWWLPMWYLRMSSLQRLTWGRNWIGVFRYLLDPLSDHINFFSVLINVVWSETCVPTIEFGIFYFSDTVLYFAKVWLC